MNIENCCNSNSDFLGPSCGLSKSGAFIIKIDANFTLMLSVCSSGLFINYEGYLCDSNGYPFKISKMDWSTFQQLASLAHSQSSFEYQSQSQNIRVQSKQENNKNKMESSLILLVRDVKIAVDCLYVSGLVNRSNKSLFLRNLKDARLISKLRSTKIQEDKDIEQIVCQVNKLSIQKSNQSQQELVVKDIRTLSIARFDEIKRQSQTLKNTENIQNYLKKAESQVISGGFFEISKQICEVNSHASTLDSQRFRSEQRFSLNSDQEVSFQILARKSLKQSRMSEPADALKLEKQLCIVGRLRNKRYILKYYRPCSFLSIDTRKNINSLPVKGLQMIQQKPEEPITSVLMEFHPSTLSDLIYSESTSQSLREKMCYQMVKAVKNLHESGVIHRDIKPNNFLYDQANRRLKIIDFAESAIHVESLSRSVHSSNYEKQIFQDFNPKFYASTLPYSPVQCLLKKGSRMDSGINNFKIDSWSLAMVLPEILYAQKTINFCPAYQDDIIKMVKDGRFQVFFSRASQSGLRLVQSLVHAIAGINLTSQQEKRLEVSRIHQVFKTVRMYTRTLKRDIRERNQKQIGLNSNQVTTP